VQSRLATSSSADAVLVPGATGGSAIVSGDAELIASARRRVAALVAETTGGAPIEIAPIPHGLGARRFFRVRLAPGSALRESRDGKQVASIVARVEQEEDPALRPAGVPPEPPLEPLRTALEEAGLPVPASYAKEDGITLLEDVGDTSLEQAAAARGAAEIASLYREACSLIPQLQRVRPRDDVPAFERRLDEALFRYKAEQVVSWTLPWARGTSEATPAEAHVVREGFASIAEACRTAPRRLSHRDFKAANLHVRGAEAPRLVMIDIQGAFLAPPEYDLVCLLRDSHVELPEELVRELQQTVRPELPDAPDEETFLRRFTLLTLTRNGKDLSRYLYAATERGDERYLRLLPRAVATLKAAAALAVRWEPPVSRLADLVLSLPEPPCER
jgi:aminoglycoside/choline kinase family phosphotransferase